MVIQSLRTFSFVKVLLEAQRLRISSEIKINEECISVTPKEINLSCNIKIIYCWSPIRAYKKLKQYFEAGNDKFTWIQDPFSAKARIYFFRRRISYWLFLLLDYIARKLTLNKKLGSPYPILFRDLTSCEMNIKPIHPINNFINVNHQWTFNELFVYLIYFSTKLTTWWLSSLNMDITETVKIRYYLLNG